MRKIINISVPETLYSEVSREVKEGGFATTSEFFRNLFRMWKDHQIYNEVMESKKDFKEGRWKILRSIKDLR